MVTLDVGSHTIKLAEFSVKKKVPFLENFAFLPVPENCIEQGDLVDPEPFTEVLPEFISQNTTAPVSDLYVSMSGRSVIVKKIEVLKSDKELMDDLVQEEVSQNLPFNLDEINYDYIKMSAPAPTSESKINILLVAAKNDVVYKINRLIEGMGYHCLSIDMGAFSLSECVKFMDSQKKGDKRDKGDNVLILDIGKSGTMFNVLHKGELIFSRYMTVGSDFYTISLQQEMGVEYQEAESLKVSYCAGGEAPPEMNRVMAEGDRYFCDEIFVGCEYFKNQFPNEELSHGYVTGGGSKMQGLLSSFEGKFNIPIHLLDPFTSLKAGDFLQDSFSHIRHFAPIALGSCLRGIRK